MCRNRQEGDSGELRAGILSDWRHDQQYGSNGTSRNPYKERPTLAPSQEFKTEGRKMRANGLLSLALGLIALTGTPAVAQKVKPPPPPPPTWVVIAPMNFARGNLGVGVLGGKLYAVGGSSGTQSLSSAESYNPADTNPVWTQIGTMQFARNGVGVGVANGKVYAVGG